MTDAVRITRLPDEIMFRCIRDSSCVRAVCREFRRVYDSQNTVRRIRACPSGASVSDVRDVSDVHRKALRRATHLAELSIHARRCSDVVDVLAWVASPGSLRSVTVRTAIGDLDAAWVPAFPGLTTLDLSGNRVADASPMAACTGLVALNLSDTRVSDLRPLSACTRLTRLDLRHMTVADVATCAALTNLVRLDLRHTEVTDVATLAACTGLTALSLRGTRVSDVSKLAACAGLTELDLGRTRVSDASALTSCTGLTSLDLGRSRLADVAALGAGLPGLSFLSLCCCAKVADVSGLSALVRLSRLDLSGTRVTDVSCLAACTAMTVLDLPLGACRPQTPCPVTRARRRARR